MQTQLHKIAFGGGCHWCTEAVFQSLIGVESVAQGFVASTNENVSFSEAVIVYFDSNKITLNILIEIHLRTHKSTSNHSMRNKYRSAIYNYTNEQKIEAIQIVDDLKQEFKNQLITKILLFKEFKPSQEQFQNYYYTNPNKPFCKTYINPKLKVLIEQFSEQVNIKKLSHLYHEKH